MMTISCYRLSQQQSKVLITLAIVIALLLSTACSTSVQTTQSHNTASTDSAIANAQEQQIIVRLQQQAAAWHGVPYRYGGIDKSGTDCSGFTYITYRELFDHHLPRTTAAQAQSGITVDKSTLRAGDLLFFKTGFKQRHVGVYIADGRFVHASSSKGVTTSDLSNPYWRDNYWHSRRLVFNNEAVSQDSSASLTSAYQQAKEKPQS